MDLCLRRGRGRGRGNRPRRLVPYSSRARVPRGAIISSYHSPRDGVESSSDDSTQPPSQVWETSPSFPILQPEPSRAENVHTSHDHPIPQPEASRDENAADMPTVPVVNQVLTKRGRGPAKSTEFDKLR
ncbi:hypothetical protein I3842_06G047100 [Carya illinoinensis]|uniref:Uncharacterized protein n=1 Tax=Carya illinoinensis TaxID=32201 RepID=A0A922ERX8_CARIL|nr:hypothetical protein I3842_06G047100 [Carya illinoinensis]